MKWNHVILGFAVLVMAGCSRTAPPPRPITLATTTSTQDSGLLDVLVPQFRNETGIEVKVVAVGSGQALQLGRRGDADVLLTHSPAAELEFEREGFSLERVPVMANDFLLAGPPDDPAHVRGTKSITEALAELARRQALFVSRADDSGTHQRERGLWKASRVEPQGDWYLRAGTGMAQALRMADQRRAYILTDRGTYLALRDQLDLEAVSKGDPLLQNPYHVLIVAPGKHPQVNVAGAREFVRFLTSPSTRQVIAGFGIDRYGQSLFTPTTRSDRDEAEGKLPGGAK